MAIMLKTCLYKTRIFAIIGFVFTAFGTGHNLKH